MDPPLSVPIMNGLLLQYTHIEGVFQICYGIDLIYQLQNEAVNTCSNGKKTSGTHNANSIFHHVFNFIFSITDITAFSRSRFNCGQLFTSPVTFTLCNQSYTIQKHYLLMVRILNRT